MPEPLEAEEGKERYSPRAFGESTTLWFLTCVLQNYERIHRFWAIQFMVIYYSRKEIQWPYKIFVGNRDRPVYSPRKCLINVSYYGNSTWDFKHKPVFLELLNFPAYFFSATEGHIYDGLSWNVGVIHGHKILHGTKEQVSSSQSESL